MKTNGSKMRWFNIASLVSMVFVGCTLALWLATFAVDPWDHKLSLTQNFHFNVWSGNRDIGCCLVVFNNAKLGPYVGSIIAMDGDSPHPPIRAGWHLGNYDIGQITHFDQQAAVSIKEKGCDLPGIYFRHVWWQNQVLPRWTLMASLWYPLFLFSILPAIWIFRRWRLRKKQIGG